LNTFIIENKDLIMSNKKDFELIEAFFDNNLTQNEERKLQDKLKTNDEFAKQFQFRKNLEINVQNAIEYKKVRNNIAVVLEQKPTISLNTKIFFAIAASVILLLGVYILIKPENSEKNTLVTLKKSDSIAYAKTDTYSEEIDISPGQIFEIKQIELLDKFILPPQFIEKNILANGDRVSYLLIYRINNKVDTLYYFGNRPLYSDSYIYIGDSLINSIDYLKILSMVNDGHYVLISKDSIIR